MMKIKVTSISVDDQEKALRFYADILGLVKKADVTQGPYRWLTVASPEEPDGVELQFAPMTTRRLDMDPQQHEDVTGDRRADASRVRNLSGDT
jgi:catechol 2,3-dioxygenase-like lactoylglutathione lyase family enzyme